jgi:histone-lysine N-methyltransferase ASH1L
MSLSPSQSSVSAAPLDSGSEHVASATSTPPTNFSDNISVASDGIKVETTPAPEATAAATSTAPAQTTQTTPAAPESGRPRRARASLPVYNLAKLSGTSHGKRRVNGDEPTSARKRRNVSGETLVAEPQAPRPATSGADTAVRDGINALDLEWSIDKLDTPGKKKAASEIIPRATRSKASLLGEKSKAVMTKATVLGKRGRKAFEAGITKMSRELRRLQDTNEFTGIETKPVLHTIWAKGKQVTLEELEARAAAPPPAKKAKVGPNGDKMPVEESAKDKKKDSATEETIEVHTRKGRRTKRWLDRGLYAGQPTPTTLSDGLSTAAEKKRLAEIPEFPSNAPINKTFPLPMFNGLRTLMNGRDFKLPFDVFNPLPPGQPKPEHWTKISKSMLPSLPTAPAAR